MNKKNSLILPLSIFAFAALSISEFGEMANIENVGTPTKKLTKDELLQQKGLKEYHFQKGSLFALNHKNAIRKAKNKGWL